MSRRAAVEAAAGIAVLSMMDALIKGVSARYPVFEIAFARYLFGSLVILGIAAVQRPGWPSAETLRANGIRALLVVVTATTFFYALSVLPLAETLALSFVAPILMAFFAALMLGEAVDGRIVAALAAGTAGMAVIVWGQMETPRLDGSLWGVGAALVSAVTYALSMVMLRARARHDPVVTIVAVQNIAPGLILAGPAAFVWEAPISGDWGLLALVGTLGIAGHLLMGRAYARAAAARLATLEYTALVWAALFGFAFFGEVPSATTFGGAVLIVCGALIASRR